MYYLYVTLAEYKYTWLSFITLSLSQDDAGQWQIIFYVAAGIYVMGAVVYGIFASGDRQKWAEVPLGYQPYLEDPEKDH